ncbi:MAG: sulfatase-like hydrolase/transferase [Burkholderiaceae bacterium]|jgi:lipid A ethanolaminephosphotransferase|nr:sulfatase-like hydrolase/transferase [Burkholderiaceae bacterium]
MSNSSTVVGSSSAFIAWRDSALRLWRVFDAAVARPRSARSVVVWLSLYLAAAANWSLWIELARIGGAPSIYLSSITLMALLLVCGMVAVLSLTAWSRWMKPLWFGVVVIAAVTQHYMLSYHAVMDPTMMANALLTDTAEVRNLMSWRMASNVLWVAALPAWALWRVPIVRQPFFSQAWRNAALLLMAVAVAAAGVLVTNRQFAPLMRNNVHLRYMLNPLASFYSTTVAAAKPWLRRQRKLIAVSGGAALGASYAGQARPPLLVLVVGETARTDHFGLNGYARDTTPELAARQVLSYRNVRSCGTNTAASLPCMFSPLGKKAFEARRDDYENLMDVLQAAGLAVFWLDNQPGGCKGVCNRVPHASAFAQADAATRRALCDGDECLDDVMLSEPVNEFSASEQVARTCPIEAQSAAIPGGIASICNEERARSGGMSGRDEFIHRLSGLDARIAALAPERRAQGIVLVMHQMGSHGPAYYKRSAPDVKRFTPECKTNALDECGHAELINAYDNSIIQTDRFLAKVIDWLRAQSAHFDSALLYLSDHGESLGEYGLYLHGAPYRLAPDAQKQVPMVTWFGDGMARRNKLSRACMAASLDKPLTHDHLYHTVLGLMDVDTPTYKPVLDALAACRESESVASVARYASVPPRK